jgi:hypothetical protein
VKLDGNKAEEEMNNALEKALEDYSKEHTDRIYKNPIE